MSAPPIVLATYADHALHVFTRDDSGAIAQVAQLVSANGITPTAMVEMVADLTTALGWVAPHVKAKPEALPKPKAEALPKPKPRQRGGVSSERGDRRRNIILGALREHHPEPVSAADLRHLLSDGEWRTGAAHSTLASLVKAGHVERSGTSGSYRWSFKPVPAT